MHKCARLAPDLLVACELTASPLSTPLTLPVRHRFINLVLCVFPDVRIQLIYYGVAGQGIKVYHLLRLLDVF